MRNLGDPEASTGQDTGDPVAEALAQAVIASELSKLYGWPIERVRDTAGLIAEALSRGRQ